MRKTYVIGVVLLFAVFTACERWGGRLDNLDSESSVGKGSGSGSGTGSSVDKGSLYGDLLYILRDEDGVPVYSEGGFVQPLVFVDGEPFLYTLDDGVVRQYVCGLNEDGDIEIGLYLDINGNEPLEEEIDPTKTYGAMEVEFGRTSIFRAPQSILNNAFEEAMSSLSDVTSLGVDYCGRLFGTRDDGSEKTIDSPRENMAIYQSLMDKSGYSGIINYCDDGSANPKYPNLAILFGQLESERSYLMLAASALAAANDKTGIVTVDKVEYINSFKSIVGTAPLVDNPEFYDFREFHYSRAYWLDYEIGFLVWNGVYNDGKVVVSFSVKDIFNYVMDDWGYGTQPSFTVSKDSPFVRYDNVGGFAQFADDCNQVLEYVHDDSNIVWVVPVSTEEDVIE